MIDLSAFGSDITSDKGYKQGITNNVIKIANGFTPRTINMPSVTVKYHKTSKQSIGYPKKKPEDFNKDLSNYLMKNIANDIKWLQDNEEIQDDKLCIKSTLLEEKVKWTIYPLPFGEVAIYNSDLPKMREFGSHPQTVLFKDWKISWKNLSFERILQETNITVLHEDFTIDCNKKSENATVEFKCPEKQLAVDLEKILTYKNKKQHMLLINSADPKYFYIGIHDIGFPVGVINNFNGSDEDLKKFFVSTFPALDISLQFKSEILDFTCIEIWKEEHIIKIGPFNKEETAVIFLFSFKGHGFLLEQNKVYYVIIPQNDNNNKICQKEIKRRNNMNIKYTTITKRELINNNDDLPGPRKVLCFKFFNNGDRTIYINPDYKYGNLTPFSLWLRWKEHRLTADICNLLTLQCYTKLLFCEEDYKNGILHTLGAIVNETIKFTDINPTNKVKPKLSKGIIVVTLQLLKQNLNNYSLQKYNGFKILVLIPSNELYDIELDDFRKILQYKYEKFHVIDLILFDENKKFDNFDEELQNIIKIDKVNAPNPEKLKTLYRNWIENPNHEKPDLQLVQNLFITKPVSRVLLSIRTSKLETCYIKNYKLLKKWNGCGASTNLRIIGYALKDEFLVIEYTINKNTSYENIAKKISSLNKNKKLPICVLIDDITNETDSNNIISLFSKYCKENKSKMIIISVNSFGKEGSFISPFLDLYDVNKFCNQLIQFFPENTSAIKQTKKHAKVNNEQYKDFNTHMYVFCLAATKGISKPPINWITECYNTLKTNNTILLCANAICFTSIFSYRACIAKNFINNTVKKLDGLKDIFEQLFIVLPNTNNIKYYSSCHSFFALLFLQHQNYFDFTNFNPKQVVSSFKDIIVKLLDEDLRPSESKIIIESCLTYRNNNKRFTRLIEILLTGQIIKPIGIGNDNITEIDIRKNLLEDLVSMVNCDKHIDVNNHIKIVKARFYRILAIQTSDKKFAKYSVEQARQALSFFSNSKEYENYSNLATHNLAMSQAALFNTTLKGNNLQSANKNFETYYKSITNDDEKYRAAKTAYKKLSLSPDKFWELKDQETYKNIIEDWRKKFPSNQEENMENVENITENWWQVEYPTCKLYYN